MAENTCNDINGNPINQFVFNDDGVVYGVVNYDGSSTNYETTVPYSGDGDLVDLTLECCSGLGFNYESDQGKCYYRETCDIDTQVKIVFNVNENNGLVFTQETDQECGLNLKFDYLIEYDSTNIYNQVQENNRNVVDIIQNLSLSILIEKVVDKESTVDGVYFENTKSLETVLEQPIYPAGDLNSETGIILSGTLINIVKNKLQSELGNTYGDNILDSHWLSSNIMINDPNVISQIINEEVKFSLLVTDSLIDFSVIMDNIELDKICDKDYVERRTIDESPSFNMVKTIDNKKSWVSTEENREHTLSTRETYYDTKSDKLILNSKEIELSTSVFDAIEQDIVAYMQDNDEMYSGRATDDNLWGPNLYNLLSTDISTLKSIVGILEVLKTELIDVNTRKTLIGYPLLSVIYERYLFSEGSNKYDYNRLNGFIEMLGGYWVDLIEQVIPATTIWGSTNKVGTTIFQPNKFQYNKYNLYYSHTLDPEAIADNDDVVVEVIAKEITQLNPITETRDKLFIYSFSNSATMYGKVSILGTDGTNNISN